MKRSLKKAIAFVLSLALALQLVVFNSPVTAVYAAELSDFDVSDYGDGELYVYEYLGTDEDVVIPSDEGIVSVSLWGGSFKTLTVPEGVTSVSVSVDTLEEITLPSTLSSLYLSYCSNLKKIDLSNVKVNSEYGSYEMYELPALEELKIGNLGGWASLSSLKNLKEADFSASNLESIYLYDNESLSTVKFNKNLDYVSLNNLPAIKNVEIPEKASPFLSNVDFDNIIIKNNKQGYSIEDGGLYVEYEDSETKENIKALEAIDMTKETINVADGTKIIENLCLSDNYYKTRIINLPDSVEMLGWGAFDGGDQIEKLTLSKNLITMQGYSIGGFNPKAEIVIPASVKYIDWDAFTGFKGKVSLEKETPALMNYEGGIYNYNLNEDGTRMETNICGLVFYPHDKKTIKFNPDTVYIAPNVFRDSAVKSLEIPNGVMWLDLYLKSCKNLTSISIPESVYWIYRPMLIYAPALKKVTIDPNNEYLASYKNCVYNKEMTALLDVPGALETIDIPEGVISLNYYTVVNHYFYDEDSETKISPKVSFPSTITEFSEPSFGSATIYADTPLAEYLQKANEEFKYWGEFYGYDPELYNYTFKDSVSDLLNMIYVVDSATVKKGKKTIVSAEMPLGMNAVTALTLGNNSECQVKFSSSNKKIATVNSKTGAVKGKKKGTCTINVKCTIKNGKKSTSKTFKIKLKVK